MPLSGWFLSNYGWYKPLYIGGSLVALVTSALIGKPACCSVETKQPPGLLTSRAAHYVERETAVGIFYVIELFLGGSTGAYTQSSFAVIQSVLTPEEAPSGIALMLICKS